MVAAIMTLGNFGGKLAAAIMTLGNFGGKLAVMTLC